MSRAPGRNRFDTVSIAGTSVFGALATMLAAASQGLGLNFPLIPYLQFDFGEIAIFLAFFIFGPLPAVAASGVEFAALEFFGQNLPYGPVLKLVALLSSIGGLWLGTWTARRMRSRGVKSSLALGGVAGIVSRAAVMSVANYYLIQSVFSLEGVTSFLTGIFASFGMTMTAANAMTLILGFTAVFNTLQLAFALAISYLVLRVSAVSGLKIGGRSPWFLSRTGSGTQAAAHQDIIP